MTSQKKPLNPDARLAQIYPAKDFTSSLCRQDSWSSGTRQSPLACHIFGQWMRADVYPLGSAYVPFAHFSFSSANLNFVCHVFNSSLVAKCTTSTPTPTIQQRSQQSLSRRRSSTIPIQCSSSIRVLRTLVVCLDGFLSKGLSTVRASPTQRTTVTYSS